MILDSCADTCTTTLAQLSATECRWQPTWPSVSSFSDNAGFSIIIIILFKFNFIGCNQHTHSDRFVNIYIKYFVFVEVHSEHEQHCDRRSPHVSLPLLPRKTSGQQIPFASLHFSNIISVCLSRFKRNFCKFITLLQVVVFLWVYFF